MQNLEIAKSLMDITDQQQQQHKRRNRIYWQEEKKKTGSRKPQESNWEKIKMVVMANINREKRYGILRTLDKGMKTISTFT